MAIYLAHIADSRRAVRIKGYAREWGASGFRSGFMLRNLDWLDDLDLQYDASTFDTDPFEPQPDGRHTIFPFWVPRPTTDYTTNQQPGGNSFSGGYVELPYTLPQDSTLFLLLCEKTTDISASKTRLDRKHGGMALIDTHPYTWPWIGQAKRLEYPIRPYGSFWITFAQAIPEIIGLLCLDKLLLIFLRARC